MFPTTASHSGPQSDAKPQTTATTEYCANLQQWMWHYYCGYSSWQSWAALAAFPFPPPRSLSPPGTSVHTPSAPASTSAGAQQGFDTRHRHSYSYPFSFPASFSHPGGAQTEQRAAASPTPATDARTAQQQQHQQQNENEPQAGKVQFSLQSCVD